MLPYINNILLTIFPSRGEKYFGVYYRQIQDCISNLLWGREIQNTKSSDSKKIKFIFFEPALLWNFVTFRAFHLEFVLCQAHDTIFGILWARPVVLRLHVHVPEWDRLGIGNGVFFVPCILWQIAGFFLILTSCLSLDLFALVFCHVLISLAIQIEVKICWYDVYDH